MKNIFIINNYELSLFNGIGTYINQLINCLESEKNIAVSVVELYSYYEYFHIEVVEGITHFYFPRFEIGVDYERVNIVINTFLSLYIPDSKDNIFFFNYCPASSLMEKLKKTHPLSKQLYIILYIVW